MPVMTVEEALEAGKNLDFAKVWTALMETRQQIAELSAETSKLIKDLSNNIGGVNNTLGKLTEAMVSCNVWRKFEPLGYTFTTASQNREFYEDGKRLAEADFFLENGIFVMPIEVKTTLEIEDVNKHLNRIASIRHYMDSHGDNRKIVAAMAGAVVSSKVIEYAQEKGFYVLVQNGESVDVANSGPDFKALIE
jgi:predicted AAA+ superfamily ATPase